MKIIVLALATLLLSTITNVARGQVQKSQLQDGALRGSMDGRLNGLGNRDINQLQQERDSAHMRQKPKVNGKELTPQDMRQQGCPTCSVSDNVPPLTSDVIRQMAAAVKEAEIECAKARALDQYPPGCPKKP